MKKTSIPLALFALAFISCAPITGPKGTAIIFGVARYVPSLPATTFPNLSLTDDDARSMAAILESQGWTVQLFLDAEATKANLETALGSLANTEAPVLFYYSGHGTYMENLANILTFYICTYGSVTSPETLDVTMMTSPAEINAMFKDNNIRGGIAILDSCNSGGFVAADGTASGLPDDYTPGSADLNGDGIGDNDILSVKGLLSPAIKAYADYSQVDGALFISAAGAQEESWESSSLGHGIFTYFLLESAKSGDVDGDGFVSTLEAFNYATRKIDETWNASSAEPYLPHYSGEPRDYILFKTVK